MSESVVHQQHSDDPQQRELLRVCRIGRAQGLKGEVTVQVFTDEPDYRFEPGSLLYTRDSEQEFEVAHSRTFKNRWIIHFEGVDDRDAAEALNGTTALNTIALLQGAHILRVHDVKAAAEAVQIVEKMRECRND